MPGKSKYRCDEHVKCTCYCKDSATEIKCKGLCGTHTVNVFKNSEDKKEHKYDFCNGLYWNCPVYIGLELNKGN